MTAPVIDIVTPTLWRHNRLRAYCENIFTATRSSCIVTFVAEGDDQATLDTVDELIAWDRRVRLLINERRACTTGAYNTAMGHLVTPWWFASGDDLVFADGWDVPVMKLAAEGKWKVIGTNDLGNPDVLRGITATHFLVESDYILTQGGVLDLRPGLAGCEDYQHNFFDCELVETAHERGVWVPCLESHVEHRHWVFGKSGIDATYARTRPFEHPDRVLWGERRKMFKEARV